MSSLVLVGRPVNTSAVVVTARDRAGVPTIASCPCSLCGRQVVVYLRNADHLTWLHTHASEYTCADCDREAAACHAHAVGQEQDR